jgi:DNA polymerase III alpha subunit
MTSEEVGMARFTCLHTLSWYSVLEGVDSPAALARQAAESGYDTLALTDVNSLAGAVEFTRAARQAGVRPLLGARLRQQGQAVTAVIAEPPGWTSLCRIISKLNARTSTPFVQLLAQHADGLHLLVDNPFILKPPLTDSYRGRLWAELVRPGPSDARELGLVEAGSRCGARPVASLGAHFACPSGLAAYRLLTALRQHQTLDDLPGRLPVLPAHHLAGLAEVQERFRDAPDALANAARLAEMCRGDVLPRGRVAPPARVPDGQDADSYLRLLCERALPQRAWSDEPAVRRRLGEELALVGQHDLAPYLLAVHEIAAEARQRGWPFALRGSAAASLVCHLLGVTDVNPLAHNLRLERFLHAGRAELPDIDLEFAAQYRSGIFTWAVRHFGAGHVARVGSWHHYQAESAFAAAAAAHGLTKQQLQPLREALGDELQGLTRDGPTPEGLALPPAAWPLDPALWPRVLANACLLLGRPHQLVKHPCGFVLTGKPAEDVVPLQRGPADVPLSQLDQDGVEAVGLMKLDLLSNRALSTLSEARQHARALASADAGVAPDEDTDPDTLALLARGDTLGVSQLETPRLRLLLRQLRPRGFTDVAQALAVARPAEAAGRDAFLRRRCGAEPAAYAHPAWEGVLRESHGILLYDDDVTAVIETLTGVPPGDADGLRKRLTDPETAGEAGGVFLGLCERAGVPRASAERALAEVRAFRGYGFCKAHAVSCTRIAWQECFLKAHEPVAFWCAVMNHHQGGYPRRVHVEAAKRSGMSFYGPCVNRSQLAFTQEVSGIRVGLQAVLHLGPEAAQAVLDERQSGGPFQGLADFRKRVTIKAAALALLIRAGAFDFTGRSRAALLREADAGKGCPPPPRQDAEPWPFGGLPPDRSPLAGNWRDEWEVLGFLPGPALMSLVRACVPAGLPDSRTLHDRVGERVRLAGLVAAPERPGADRRRVTLEDEWGPVDADVGGDDADLGALGPVALAEGDVQERHRIPMLEDAKLERPLPGAALPRAAEGGVPCRHREDARTA